MSWLNQIVQGVLLGGYYALLACGISFMFGVMRIINLAHGSLAVVAAYGVFYLADRYELNPFIGLACAIPVMAIVGWILHRLVLERSARAGELVPILATFGLAVVLDNTLFVSFGADTRSLAPYIDTLAYDGVDIAGLTLGHLSLLTFGVAVVLLGGLQLMLDRTPLGRKIRAVADDPATAQLVGVNAVAINAIAAAIAMATVAIAGVFLAMRATVDPYAGGPQLIFAFEAVMIGGIGSLWGTLGGGIALGVAQSIGAKIHSQGFLIAGHVLFLVVLLSRIVLNGRSLRSFVRTR
ncbi:branched-chain amino acid ABC transporter permease [Pararobbsia silviterrae]|uniref:Branched-chain amino acid ABC transporter permease n=1 Tax=Pararobbsia silviterrae TaxID=1792498 RepID=A0A494XRT9_9BURK|nr:branched-chain amino acid ABC transporter permease [Pararobbsia silviterrae]RKP53357.1 branched-chain amino acid ABC transporter permease [Pararobbsia silviterrae]